jgi:hypothetical protein
MPVFVVAPAATHDNVASLDLERTKLGRVVFDHAIERLVTERLGDGTDERIPLSVPIDFARKSMAGRRRSGGVMVQILSVELVSKETEFRQRLGGTVLA